MHNAPNSPAARDIAYLTHPYSIFREHEKVGPVIVERGEGIYVFDERGKEYIEGLAGLWSVAVGFNEKRLVRGAIEQMNRLPFYHTFVNKEIRRPEYGRRGYLWLWQVGKAVRFRGFHIEPDTMSLSKAITSSYQPLSALLFTDEIYQHVADETNRIGVFGHGFTASGHPVGTAVALENLRIIDEDGLVENARRMGTHLHRCLESIVAHPIVGEIRGIGLMAGMLSLKCITRDIEDRR
jgi:adenosylmethionine-8-amino-7-oxononanoate aminotransferase